jgi:hypothetical protein
MKVSKETLDSALREAVQTQVVRLNEEIERTLRGSVTPNATNCFSIKRIRRYQELSALAIFSWYFDTGVLLREDIMSKHLPWKQKVTLGLLCSSKESMLEYMTTYSDRELFGNVIPRVESCARKVRFLTLLPQRAKKVLRHRGYRDHGSCRPQSHWLETRDWTFTEVQNRLESAKAALDKVLLSVEKWGCLGLRLPRLE